MRKGIWGFALVAIMLLMASCSSKSEYANAIPKDAAMVMSFDFKTMAEKSGSECLRPDNAVRNHAKQILRYFDTVHFACPDPIDKDISYGLGFNFVSFPPVPIHGFQNLRLFLFRDVFQSFNRRLGIAFLSAIRFISSNGHTHIGSHS